jgi:ACS family tartrate transporter-like MFS transporter
LTALQALRHPRVWLLGCIGLTSAIAAYSLVFWAPQLVKALSATYSGTQVGFLVATVHSLGLLAMILVARSSDGNLERRYHMMFSLIAGGTGFVAMSAVHTSLGVIALLSLAAVGVYGMFGPFFASATGFLTGLSAASGIALITSIANLGGFAGPYLVGVATNRTGNAYAGLLLVGLSLFVSAALCLLLPREQPIVARAEETAA